MVRFFTSLREAAYFKVMGTKCSAYSFCSDVKVYKGFYKLNEKTLLV